MHFGFIGALFEFKLQCNACFLIQFECKASSFKSFKGFSFTSHFYSQFHDFILLTHGFSILRFHALDISFHGSLHNSSKHLDQFSSSENLDQFSSSEHLHQFKVHL